MCFLLGKDILLLTRLCMKMLGIFYIIITMYVMFYENDESAICARIDSIQIYIYIMHIV